MQPIRGNEWKEGGFIVRGQKYASHACMREGRDILDERKLKNTGAISEEAGQDKKIG
jgi:hypothetical protein